LTACASNFIIKGFHVTRSISSQYLRLILSFCLLAFSHALADEARPEPPLQLTSENLAKVIDPLVTEWIDKHKGAGAVVAVTKRDGLLFAKAYGRADVEAGTPFTADATLVRPGSISKLFTGIAVMQLVDQGKLDLDRNVNDYLDFSIPTPEGGVPVTLRRLLTHRAGFEEHAKNLFSKHREPEPLGRWLAHSLPPRLFPTGDVAAYSNYGFALAGYVVERVSGEPFAEYASRHILKPLGMTSSTFQQPLPLSLAPKMAKAYRTAGKPLGFFETIAAAPAGGLSATGVDMARFMRALLNRGSIERTQILGAARFDEMTSPQQESAAGYMGLAFIARKLNGHETIGHGGATLGFFSDLALFPGEDLGIFVSLDGMQSAGKAPQIANVIVERFLPKRVETNASATPLRADPAIAGVYQSSRRADSSFLKAAALLAQLSVSVDDQGMVTVVPAIWPFGKGFDAKRVGANLYEGPKGLQLAFEQKAGTEGRFISPAMEFHRAPWWEDARLVAPAMAASILILFLTLLAWPIAAFWRRRRERMLSRDPRDRRMHAMVRIIALIDAAVIAASGALYFGGQNMVFLSDAFDPAILALSGLAWLGVLGAIPCIRIAISFWRRNVGGWWTRAHHSLIAISATAVAWFFVTFHLAGTTLNY
jgi:CubicO group peptidase (beta-lactamase class C family)